MPNKVLQWFAHSPFSKKAQFTLALLFLSIGSGLIFFCIGTSSDALLEEVWARALYTRGLGAWYDLLFTFAPAYFPDFTGHLLAKLAGLDVISTIYIATLFQIAIFILSVFAVTRELGLGKIDQRLSVLLFIALMTLLSAQYAGMWLWYYSTNDNLSATIVGFLALALSLRYLKAPRFSLWLGLASLTAFGVLNGRLFILTYIAPALAASLSLLGLQIRNGSGTRWTSHLRSPLASILNASLIGLFATLSFFEPVINPFSTAAAKLSSGGSFLKSLHAFLMALVGGLNANDPLLAIVILVAIVMVGISTWLGLRECLRLLRRDRFKTAARRIGETQPLATDFFYAFASAALLGNLTGPIVAGQITDNLATFRYFSTLLTIAPLLLLFHFSSARSQEERPGLKRGHAAWTVARLNSVLIAALTVLTAAVIAGPRRSIAQVRQEVPSTKEAEVAACLDRYADEHHLRLGVSDYWNSYSVSFLSKKSIWINPVCASMEACVALDRYLYSNPPGLSSEGDAPYNFVLISNNDQFQFTADAVRSSVGEPDRVLACPHGYQVFVFERARADFNKLLRERFEVMKFQYEMIEEIEIPRSEWLRITGDWKPVKAPDLDAQTPLGWTFGSFRKFLRPGKYLATIDVETVPLTSDPQARVAAIGFGDVLAPAHPENGDLRQQGAFVLAGDRTQHIEVPFTVRGKAQFNLWGFWMYNYGGAEVRIKRAAIRRLK